MDESGASWRMFKRKARINDNARGAFDMYSDGPYAGESVPVGAELAAYLSGGPK